MFLRSRALDSLGINASITETITHNGLHEIRSTTERSTVGMANIV
eukprot:COSAG02_NODE_51349_length_314_cov_1.358140_1_plen_44_part_01